MSGAGTGAAPPGFGMGALAEFWAQAGQSAMQVQEKAGQMMAEAIKAMPGLGGDSPAFAALSPDTAELARAGQAMSDLWAAATGPSQTMSAALASVGRTADPTMDATLRAVADPRTWLASMGGMDGQRVDLGRITMPVLNVYAKDDHIIAPATSRALGAKVGTPDYEELALPGGHVGVFVGGRSQKLFAPAIAAFLQKHDAAGQAEGAPLA